MLKNKKILILGGSVFQIPFIKKAHEMGLIVGLVDIKKIHQQKIMLISFINAA